LHALPPTQCLFPQQAPEGIDAGAFHSDVLAVGNGEFFMLHADAFRDVDGLLAQIQEGLGPLFRYALASREELPVDTAVATYPFNSQLLTLPNGDMAIVAPAEAGEEPRCRAFFDRVLAEDNPVRQVFYRDVRQSMRNGGGPACLRLRVCLTDAERAAVSARVFWTAELGQELEDWVRRHYRDRLDGDDLRDPALARESMAALDELTRILRLGSVYDFQQ
jgi:succinylarginine dihydrolase